MKVRKGPLREELLGRLADFDFGKEGVVGAQEYQCVQSGDQRERRPHGLVTENLGQLAFRLLCSLKRNLHEWEQKSLVFLPTERDQSGAPQKQPVEKEDVGSPDEVRKQPGAIGNTGAVGQARVYPFHGRVGLTGAGQHSKPKLLGDVEVLNL